MSRQSGVKERVFVFLTGTVLPTIAFLLVLIGAYCVAGVALRTDAPVRLVQIDMSPWYVTSMYPALVAGDVIVVEGVGQDDVRVGDVIIFERPYSSVPIIHRVIEIVEYPGGGKAFRTKGDYNPIPDSMLVSPSELLGRWTGIKVQLVGLPIIFAMDPLGRIVIVAAIVGLSLYSILVPEEEVSEELPRSSDEELR
jgi:signal peptidase